MVWNYHLLKNFPQFVVTHTVKGFSIVNEAEVVCFVLFCFVLFCFVFRFPFFLYDSVNDGNLISGPSACLL